MSAKAAPPSPTKRVASVFPWLLAAATGGLLGMSFPPFELGWLAWFALVPLTCALWFFRTKECSQPMRAFGLGYVAGLVFFWITMQWVTEVSTLGWFAMAFYLGLYPALWAMLLEIFGRPNWLSSASNLRLGILGAAAWVALEWLRGTLLTGLAWNSLGVALFEFTAIIQIADFAGVGGISFLVVLVNLIGVLTVRRLFLELGRMRIRPHYDFSLTVALVAAAFSYGVHHYYRESPPSIPLKIAAIQPNIPQHIKWDPEFEERILDTLRMLSETASALAPDLLIWPEAATPRPLLLDPEMQREAVEIVEQLNGGSLLLGTIHYSHDGDFNSAVLVGPGGAVQLYNKIHLVPFGEYIPFRHTFPLFAWIAGTQVPSDFDAGTEAVVMQLAPHGINVAPLICFEDTVAELTRRFTSRGAQLLVTLTNDGWFRESPGSRQHLINSIFRSVESKLPLVRAANTGVTAVVDRLGRITHVLEEDGNTFIEGVLSATVAVPENPKRTFFTRYGELFSVTCLILTIVALFAHLASFRIAREP